MKKYLTLLILPLLLITSCNKNKSDDPGPGMSDSPLFASWVGQDYEDDIYTMYKSDSGLDKDLYGFAFYSNGTFIERKNAGWCGTPPITYDNFSGTWTQVSENLYLINVGYWGGEQTYEVEVISLEENTLRVRFNYDL